MPGLDCIECKDGTWDCGDNPCPSGGGTIPWVSQGTVWMPLEMGIDGAIRVLTRIEFLRDARGELKIDDSNNPRYKLTVRLELPLRHACVRQGRCPD